MSAAGSSPSPAAEFRKMIQADPELAIAGRIWQPWLPFRRCVSGHVRRCFPFLHVLDDILVSRNLARLSRGAQGW